MYRFVDDGYDATNKGKPSEEVDEEAEKNFERHVGINIPDFTVMLEAIAPYLRRFSGMTDSVNRYIDKQKRQIEYLTAILILSYVSGILVSLFVVYRLWSATKKYYNLSYGFTRVAILFIAFLFVQSLVFSMKIALEKRREAVDQLQVGVLEKYDISLGQNVYVKFAEAYSLGPQQGKKFVTEYAEEKLRSQETETDDLVFNFCAQSQDGETFPVRECIIDPCPPQELESVIRKSIKNTWARRNFTVSDCDRTMLALLRSLSDIQTGEVFESNDPFAMWRGIQSGVDVLRDFVYRKLDVKSRQRLDRDSALQVVKNSVIPALFIPAVECTDLVPEAASDISSFDHTITDKERCWRRAMDDPKCAWAYFHPCKGGLFGSSSCEDDDDDSPVTCVSAKARNPVSLRFRSTKHFEDGHGNATRNGSSDNTGSSPGRGVLLLKENGGALGRDYDQYIVADFLTDAKQALPDDWAATSLTKAGDDRFTTDVQRPFLDSSDARVVVKTVANSTESSHEGNDEGATHVYRSYMPGNTNQTNDYTNDSDDMIRYYYDIFETAQEKRASIPRSSAVDQVFVKVNFGELFDSNTKKFTYASFYALMPVLQDAVVEILKPHHHAVRLEEYVDYMMTELQKGYGSERFQTIRPLLEDLFRKIMHVMDNLRIGSRERTTYVSTTRFEEKLKNLSYAESKRLLEEVGMLAKMTKLYVNKYPTKEQDRGGYNVAMLWSTTGVLTLLFSLILYNMFSVGSMTKLDTNSVFRNVAISFCIFVFMLVVMGSMVFRYLAKKRFNEQISDDNSKRLVSSSVRTMDLLSQHLENMANKRRMEMKNSFNMSVVKNEFIDLYYRIGHVGRARALESTLDHGGACLEVSRQECNSSGSMMCGTANNKRCPKGQCCTLAGCCVDCDRIDPYDMRKVPHKFHNLTDEQVQERAPFRTQLASTPPNYSELFLQMRRTIGSYDTCNNITVPNRPPFPTFEIVLYTLVAFVALALLFYSYAKIDPIGRVRNINILNDVIGELRAGYGSSVDVSGLAACRGIPKDVLTLVLNIVVVMSVVLVFMVIYFIVHSSRTFENSLYMSGLYSEGKCTK